LALPKNNTLFYSDEELLQMIKVSSSKEQAYKYIMNTHQERIYWVIRKIVMTHEDTDDVIQNTFIKAFRSIENFEGRSSIYVWLHRIAINEAITYKNKNSKHTRIIPIDQANAESSASSYDTEDSELIIQKLEKAIEVLPEKQKAVFLMRYYEEMPYEQMSQKLSTSVGALKASYHHAIKKIEEMITR
jgi:RNA polymerase sigma factor (sigma-70 family)